VNDYRGNTFLEIERALKLGIPVVQLSTEQMRQILAEVDALVEKANALVRENNELRDTLGGNKC
jgi:regulator of replication initiation timing